TSLRRCSADMRATSGSSLGRPWMTLMKRWLSPGLIVMCQLSVDLSLCLRFRVLTEESSSSVLPLVEKLRRRRVEGTNVGTLNMVSSWLDGAVDERRICGTDPSEDASVGEYSSRLVSGVR